MSQMSQRLIIFLFVISLNSLHSQSKMITENIQTTIINKKWTLNLEKPDALVFDFKKDEMNLFIKGNLIGSTPYYFERFSGDKKTIFTKDKIGSDSDGNYVVTQRRIYEIELFSDRKSFRIKAITDPESKWQRYYIIQ